MSWKPLPPPARGVISQPRVAPKPPAWAMEAEKGGVSDMRQIMAQMEHRQALHKAEEKARKAVADQRGNPAAASTASSKTVLEQKPAEKDEPKEPEEEVPKCHLHRKPNKACRFCKQHSAFVEKQTAKREAAKLEVLKEIHAESETRTAKVDSDLRILLPNMSQFPQELKLRILSHRVYEMTVSDYMFNDCEDLLGEDETCEIDTQREDMLFVPSSWVMCLYRIMIIRPTDMEFHSLLNHQSIWLRSAAYFMVRVGMHQDRYWELLSTCLMDDTEFKPFPKRDPKIYTMGEYVQKLLSEDLRWA